VVGIAAVRILIFLSLAVTVFLIKVTLERCRSEKRFDFIYCLTGLFCYNLGYFIEMSSGSLQGGMIAVKVMCILFSASSFPVSFW